MSGTQSFVQRQISVTIQRANGVFADGGMNTVNLNGLRISATIERLGNVGSGRLSCRIFGLTASMMNDLSTLGMIVTTDQRNTISLYAGDATSGLGLAFTGTIYQALADFRSMPEVSFQIEAQTGLAEAITPIAPSSYQGGADVVTIISSLAAQMGRVFENNGVSGVVLSNPYFPGTAAQQVRDAADAADINLHDDGTTIAIWPKGGTRGGAIPLVSATTGMVGYPAYTANGVDIVTLFNPSIQFGGQINVQSSLPQACGNWCVYGLVHNLEAQVPGGSWFSAIRLGKVGVPVIAS